MAMQQDAYRNEPVMIAEEMELNPLSNQTSPRRRARREAVGDGYVLRPSVRLGRQLSLRRRKRLLSDDGGGGGGGVSNDVDSEFQRDAVRYRSLQHAKRSGSPVRMRRASSLTNMKTNVEWEELRVNFGDLRASTRRLEDRIAHQ